MIRTNRTTRRLIGGAARIGHVATGIVYIVVGALAVGASIDRRRHPPGPADALSELQSTGFGAVLNGIIAAGLVADALWQALRAWRDFDHVGAGVRGLVERASAAFVGLLHLGLALVAARLILGYRMSGALESQTRSWIGVTLSLPFGEWLVALLAAVTFAVAVVMIYRGLAPGVLARLNLAHLRGRLRWVASAFARLGLLARGTIYALIAAFLAAAAYHHSASQAREVGGAMRFLQYDRDGRWLLAAIALGFIANGAVELIRAWYRTIRQPR
jgi:Domain of Unknown Function (DUF1206)